MNTKIASALVLGGLFASACGDVKTIDRTQPNAIHKSQFAGLWYHRATIIDSEPGGHSLTVDGYSSSLEKLRWDITEDMLIGYRSYEFVPYGEGLDDAGRDFFGSPVVAYKIEKHFDILRDYSAATGVQSNVVVENDTDRPWHERSYIRVDWSTNMVGVPARFWTGWLRFPDGYISGTSLADHYIRDHEETNIDRPVFTEDYFDVTGRYYVEPDIYYCYVNLLFNGVPSCGGQRVKVRTAFKKVDPTDDYQTMIYPDNLELTDDAGNALVINYDGRVCGADRDPGDCRVASVPYWQAFGNIRTMRTAFDRERFLTRTGRIYLAGRFDIWQDSYDDATGALISYSNRTPKPIVYHLDADFPDQEHENDVGMVAAANRLADEWSNPFDETVAFLQGMVTAEGRGDIGALRTKYGQDFRMFHTQRNSCSVPNVRQYVLGRPEAQQEAYQQIVTRLAGGLNRLARGNIREVCAAIQFYEINTLGYTMDPKRVNAEEGRLLAFQWERQGDIRYNFQNYVEQYQPNGPWGVVVPSRDPETGELTGTTASIFAGANDMISYREVDRIQWLNGDLDDEELFRGTLTRSVVASRRPTGRSSSGMHKDIRQALNANDSDLLKKSGALLFRESPIDEEADRFKRMFGGTDIERELLVTDEILRGLAGPLTYQPSNGAPVPRELAGLTDREVFPGNVSEEALAKASPVNWGSSLDDNEYFSAFKKMAGQGVEFAEFFDLTTSGLADEWKGKPRDEIYQWLRTQLYTSVNGHEVGHAIGLDHNFGASMDPMNYKPEFWDQHWNNRQNPNNRHRGEEFKYASIMDYGFNVATDFLHGVGAYDKAAIRFMYGEIVDVWNPEKVVIPDPRKYGSFARRCGHDSAGWGLSSLGFWLDYSTLPRLVGSTPEYDENGDRVESPMEQHYRDLVGRLEANAASYNSISDCYLLIADITWLISQIESLPAKPENIHGARMLVRMEDLINQQRSIILNTPEWDDPATTEDESRNGRDDDGDGIADDSGFGCEDEAWLDSDGNQLTDNEGNPLRRRKPGTCYEDAFHRVEYEFCPDEYAGFNPGCQPWDHGADFEEQIDYIINRYESNYLFDYFRRDRVNYGNPRTHMARLEARTFFHMVNAFRYYLFYRRSALADTPVVQKWLNAAFKGVNFLERIIQTPEPGRYCLNTATNIYVEEEKNTLPTCDSPIDLGLGMEGGKFYDTAWTNEYYYKPNRIGMFYDKMAAIRQMTTSSGRFIRDFSDLFDRRAFSLGYLRAWEDPIIQRFSGLIRGDHTGYRSAILRDPDTNEPYVRYMPFFDEEDPETGGSVQLSLNTAPKIEPAWSWTLQYYALAYAISNFSSINDSSPEFYRFTKISIPGTPEDVEYPADMPLVEFTDPETRLRYRAPDIEAKGRQTLYPITPRVNRPNRWGIGADLLREANRILTEEYQPNEVACQAANDPRSTACTAFNAAHRKLRETVGYIDIMRRFNRRAEMPR